MTTAVIALAIFAQAPAKPIDEATFLREASKGWAALEKAYVDIEVKWHSAADVGVKNEESFARVGQRIRAGRPLQNPGSTRTYVTDGTAYFVVDRMAPNAPSRLLEYKAMRTADGERRLITSEVKVGEMCYGTSSGNRSWSEQIKRKGFAITRLETIKSDSRELIRMEFREDDQPDEVFSILKGWCLFDPRENYMPVESEVEFLMHANNAIASIYIEIDHKPSAAFPGIRLVPSEMSRTLINPMGKAVGTTTVTIETFAPCKLKPADFRPEAFGLETPR